jgi:signal transduction histidine kinase
MHDERSVDPAELSRQLAALEQKLFASQKMAGLGELVSTTAHEFNNILTTIINYSKIGLRQKDAATRDKAFERILAAGQRAARITNGVLGLARNRGEVREPVDLVAVVEDVLLLVERDMVRYRVQIEKQLSPVPIVMASGNQIQQVLLNLLINARQAMPNGGRIVVRTAYAPDAKMVDVSVRDTGTGIPPERLSRIFDRFYTTKSGPDASGQGGTGLGLAMCRKIMESHHGRIRVESTVGKGTAFTIRLPVDPFSCTPAEANAAVAPIEGRTERVHP